MQDALTEAEKCNAVIKPVSLLRAESSLCLRKTSIRNDDDTTLYDCQQSSSFFSINNLDRFGSNKELNSIQQDSAVVKERKQRKYSKRKHLFRINSVDDSLFK